MGLPKQVGSTRWKACRHQAFRGCLPSARSARPAGPCWEYVGKTGYVSPLGKERRSVHMGPAFLDGDLWGQLESLVERFESSSSSLGCSGWKYRGAERGQKSHRDPVAHGGASGQNQHAM